ncbi:GNAT family N-acetyltransferase [Parasedimentitalea marina]|uniref:GNAT family N-acetyltransferase n=1 Tax=Parasedimentitalea marina TaxID=2483033 RepID=A0A3T0N556_9RHOB|nr:GNAT family N-acetyltransferase [Parasedimentitalea marina]AZV79170.1 GNAT family N-acetyltransferase [Parasedimentitalea marina]
MTGPKLLLRSLDGDYAVSRVPPEDGIPDWTDGPGLVNVTQAEDEISVLCLSRRVPAQIEHSAGWTAVQVSNLFDFDEPGVVLAATRPVSMAGLGVFVVSTFYRDYLLVRHSTRHSAELAWLRAGHKLQAQNLLLRCAGPADCDQIAEFHVRMWRHTYKDMAPDAAIRALDFECRQAQWHGKLAGKRQRGLTLLAEDDQGRILGLCDLSHSQISAFPDAMELTNLYLDSAARGLGIGRHFLHLARHWAQVSGPSDLVLAVVRQNQAALDFYRACGGDPAAECLDKGPLWQSENVIMRWHSEA